MSRRNRHMRRVGELLPETAAALGLEDELRLARAMASWKRLVAELVPAAAGATELLAIRPAELVVSTSEPIVAQELRLRSGELLEAFAMAPGGARVLGLRVLLRSPQGGGRSPGWNRPAV